MFLGTLPIVIIVPPNNGTDIIIDPFLPSDITPVSFEIAIKEIMEIDPSGSIKWSYYKMNFNFCFDNVRPCA